MPAINTPHGAAEERAMNWTDDPTLSAAVDRLRELMAQHGKVTA